MASDLKGDPTTGEDMETRYKICHFHRFAYMADRCLLCEMQEAIDRTAAQNRALLAALKGIALGGCCQSPGCSPDDPKCDAMTARDAIAQAKEAK